MKNQVPKLPGEYSSLPRSQTESVLARRLAVAGLAFFAMAPAAYGSRNDQPTGLKLGIADYGQYGQTGAHNLFTAAESLKLGIVRLTFEWSPGQTELSPNQRATLGEAQEVPGVETLYTLSFDRGRDAPITESERQDFIAWATDLVSSGATLVEATNEPMEPLFWSTDNPAKQYAELLAELYPALHKANPKMTLIAGSLARHNADEFMARLTAAVNGRKLADAVSLHYTTSAADYQRRVALLHQCFGQDLPVYISEDGSNLRNEAAQAVQTANKIELARQENAAGWILLQLQDTRKFLPWHTGLRRSNDSKKPSYYAVAKAARADRSGTVLKDSN